MKNLALYYSNSSLHTEAERLAEQLKLPLSNPEDSLFAMYLVLTPEHLTLQATGPKAPKPIYVDFLSGKQAHRQRFGGGRRQLIGRAVGIKPKKSLTILDVTAGLGRDAYVLASLGCDVTMLERSPIVAALLIDGLERAKLDSSFANLAIQLIEADSREYMQSLSHTDTPDVIYIDPMFPASKKSALMKKEMRLLKTLVGEDTDAPKLLEAALKTATKRVVVKRARHAPAINGPKPDFLLKGKSTRFDLYFNTL